MQRCIWRASLWLDRLPHTHCQGLSYSQSGDHTFWVFALLLPWYGFLKDSHGWCCLIASFSILLFFVLLKSVNLVKGFLETPIGLRVALVEEGDEVFEKQLLREMGVECVICMIEKLSRELSAVDYQLRFLESHESLWVLYQRRHCMHWGLQPLIQKVQVQWVESDVYLVVPDQLQKLLSELPSPHVKDDLSTQLLPEWVLLSIWGLKSQVMNQSSLVVSIWSDHCFLVLGNQVVESELESVLILPIWFLLGRKASSTALLAIYTRTSLR